MLLKCLPAVVPLVTAGIALLTFPTSRPAVPLDRVELTATQAAETQTTAQPWPGYSSYAYRYSSPYSGYRYGGYSYSGYSYSGYRYGGYSYSGYGYSGYGNYAYGSYGYRYSGYGYSGYRYGGYHPGYRYR